MSIRAQLYGKKFWVTGNPSNEQLEYAINLLEEDLEGDAPTFTRAHWETLKSDLIDKGLRKGAKAQASEKQQIRHILPDGSKNPYREENLAKFRNEMALWGGGLNNPRANLAWQVGRKLRGGPKSPLARKQELRSYTAAEDVAVNNYKRFMELYQRAKHEGKLPPK
jgi:hypothetical protein